MGDIESSTHLFIGVCDKDISFISNCPYEKKKQWTLWLNYNEYRGLNNMEQDLKLKEFPKVKNKDIITLRIDCENKSLSYAHNGKLFPPAFKNLELPVYPMASIYNRTFGSVEFLKVRSLKVEEDLL